MVYAKVEPTLTLVIRRYVDGIYYCKVQEDPERKELVYFERELVENLKLAEKNKKSVYESIVSVFLSTYVNNQVVGRRSKNTVKFLF